jgi:hypothetical protein
MSWHNIFQKFIREELYIFIFLEVVCLVALSIPNSEQKTLARERNYARRADAYLTAQTVD